jgi:hypothetical protein
VLISPAASASVTNTITSAPFSIGLGYTSSQTWNDSETSAYNTPTTQGNFSFVPTVVSRLNSASGVYFTNRVITSQVGTDFGWSGNGGVANPSTQSAYTNTITASWLGGIPADTLTNPEINPNFRIQLNITSLRLWVSNYDGTGNPFGFVEITPGHGSSSPTITDSPTAGGAQNAPTYTQLVWDPADFTESGMASTRSFVLTAPNVADLQSTATRCSGMCNSSTRFLSRQSPRCWR